VSYFKSALKNRLAKEKKRETSNASASEPVKPLKEHVHGRKSLKAALI